MDAKFWKRVFLISCTLFTALMIVVSCIMMLANIESGIFKQAFSSFRTVMLALFSFTVVFAIAVYKQFRINEALRLAINYVLIVGSFMIFIFLPLVVENQAFYPAYISPNPVIAAVLVSIPYFIVYGICRISSKGKDKEKAKKEYKPVYKK